MLFADNNDLSFTFELHSKVKDKQDNPARFERIELQFNVGKFWASKLARAVWIFRASQSL